MNKKLAFFNGQAKFKISEEKFVILYLDIDKDIIKDIGYEYRNMDYLLSDLEKLEENLLNCSLSKAREFSLGRNLINIPIKLLHQAINSYAGQCYRFNLLGEPLHNLICRCHGIYKGTILDALKRNPEGDLLYVLDETQASGACGKCRLNVEGIIRQFKGERVIRTPKVVRTLGLSPVQLYLKVDDFIRNIDIENEIVAIKGNLVLLRVKGGEEVLRNLLVNKFKNELTFSFLT